MTAPTRPPTETDVRRALDAIRDPCSVTAGAPAGIDEFGLVRAVALADRATGLHVEVTLTVTEPFCLMGVWFLDQARTVLAALPGVATFHVRMDGAARWHERDASPAYRARLAAARAAHPATEEHPS